MPAGELDATIAAIWRIESPKLIATLSRLLRDVGRAEEINRMPSLWPSRSGPTRAFRIIPVRG